MAQKWKMHLISMHFDKFSERERERVDGKKQTTQQKKFPYKYSHNLFQLSTR